MQHWHIVYLSFETGKPGRSYIGKHSTQSLNDGYLGSYYDSSFTPDSRIILGYYKTAQAAILAEIQWQKAFRVADDPEFANQVYQTSSRFDASSLRWFYNPETKKEVYLSECPEGYLRGRPSMSDPKEQHKKHKNLSYCPGEKNGNCKLTKDKSAKIIAMKQSKQFTVKEIATMFGISPVTVWRVTTNPNYWSNR